MNFGHLIECMANKRNWSWKKKNHKRLVYQDKCGGCNATYYGKTKHYFKVRICEHLGISHLTEKKVKIDNNKLMAIQEHLFML